MLQNLFVNVVVSYALFLYVRSLFIISMFLLQGSSCENLFVRELTCNIFVKRYGYNWLKWILFWKFYWVMKQLEIILLAIYLILLYLDKKQVSIRFCLDFVISLWRLSENWARGRHLMFLIEIQSWPASCNLLLVDMGMFQWVLGSTAFSIIICFKYIFCLLYTVELLFYLNVIL